MEKPKRFLFSKNEKITSRDKIIELYKSGNAVKAFPLYAKYIETENQDVFLQILISVSKKKFKRAVHRNRIKRLIREAYRLNKHLLIEELKKNNLKIAIVFNYSLSEIADFNTISASVVKIFGKISDIINE